jgi:RNA polymerase sigma-70 factor (ECF subfamily)
MGTGGKKIGPRDRMSCMPRDFVDAFVRENWAPVWRAAYAVTADAQLAEDAAQEAFVRALRSLHRLDGRPLRPWLRRIAVNCAIDQLRRRPRGWVGAELAPDPGLAPPDGPDDDLVAAVLALPDDRRMVVVLHFWCDWTHREIADALGIPAGTVGSRLSRALDDLSLRVTEVRSGNAS